MRTAKCSNGAGGTIEGMSDKPEALTPEEREQLRRIMSKIGKAHAGKVTKERMASMTPEERSKVGENAAKARWGDRPRCPCGAMTLARARARGHKCQAP